MLTTEIKRFLTAVQFFTRIPVPNWVGFSQAQLDASARYFPWVGVLVGAAGAAVFAAALALTASVPLAALLSTVATILLTGAFHEDGFADACDGFGGGLGNRDRILTIMKDSRIGAYGAIGIGLMLAVKCAALIELAKTSAHSVLAALLFAHVFSRWCALLAMRLLSHAEHADAKVKPLATQIGWGGLVVGALPLALLGARVPTWRVGIPLLVTLALGVLLALLAMAYFKRRLGGYTGDCLGALQQVCETWTYLGLLIGFTLLPKLT